VLVDTHCHLTHERYDGDREEVLGRAGEAGVRAVISIASDPEDALRAVELARASEPGSTAGSVAGSRAGPEAGSSGSSLPRVFATAGLHPHEVGRWEPGALEGVRELLGLPQVVAVGECGLDFHYDFAPRDLQRAWFARQLELAGEVGLPAVVHCREAEAEMIPLVREAGAAGVRGVLHCHPGHLPLLETAMDAGWSVSFTGIVTFRSFEGAEAVRTVAGDRYFLETDGPYLAPVPYRGRRNEPAFVARVRDRVAELRGESTEEVAERTTRNARAFFALPEI
jgi:TatD DNase family protein